MTGVTKTKQADLTGWGRFPRIATQLHAPRTMAELTELLATGIPAIARGSGLGYGDCAVSTGQTISMRHMNRMLGLDPETGIISVQAGVTLGDIAAAMLPRGWFPPILPGSGKVTVGGAIAADIHGKNHRHAGSFGTCIDWLDVMTLPGDVTRCSATQHPELFACTVGGMGLTGIILAAGLRLTRVETGWILQEQVRTKDLAQTIAELRAPGPAPYRVAWLDGLAQGRAMGRGVVIRGRHANPADLSAAYAATPFGAGVGRKLGLGFDWPEWVLNRASMRAFNTLRYRGARTSGASQLVDWRSFFFPLDVVEDWPRAYGKRGFVQFQCVLPGEDAADGISRMLNIAQRSGCPPFLVVVKEMGQETGGMSFAMPGLTIAMDFPASAAVRSLLDKLDPVVLDHGGRFYLAKDARLRAETLHAADARAASFAAFRAQNGLSPRFQSAQSERVRL